MAMEFLNGRQRVAAASLLKRRPAPVPGTRVIVDDEAYQLWYDLVCSEMQRLGVVDPSLIKEFCDRAGVPNHGAVPLGVAPATAA
jgi:hypothetical protein